MSQPQNNVLHLLLIIVSVAFVADCPAQEKPSAGKASPNSLKGIMKNPKSPLIIRFDYYPPVGDNDPGGLVFVSIQENGMTRAIRYGAYFRTDPVTVHQGTLSKRDTSQLMTKVRRALTEWSPSRVYDNGFQDESIVHLSCEPRKDLPLEFKYSGLIDAPQDVAVLISELQMLWKRLDVMPAAYAYVRSKPINHQFPDKESIKTAQHIFVEKFPRLLRSKIINAINNPLDFLALSRSQVRQLLVVTSNQYEFPVSSNGVSHGLTLYVPPVNLRK